MTCPDAHSSFASLQVTTDHVLLGLVAEDSSSKNGYMNSGLTSERAKAAVEALSGKKKPITTTENIPFSREVRKTFEAATNVSLLHAGASHRCCHGQPTVAVC